ncbi:hypothetical protein ABID29_002106 [Streptococcus rupicaprae]|uniref:Uncharacterized protein n=1 Tax=Streptococcus rupicaprae TaxID=759619 RepID=A0ABV2FKB3_9STRE
MKNAGKGSFLDEEFSTDKGYFPQNGEKLWKTGEMRSSFALFSRKKW